MEMQFGSIKYHITHKGMRGNYREYQVWSRKPGEWQLVSTTLAKTVRDLRHRLQRDLEI